MLTIKRWKQCVLTMTNEPTTQQLKEMIIELKKRVEFLERENNRRKSEINQIGNALRRG
jgi:chaperonin cofactor prefoldin